MSNTKRLIEKITMTGCAVKIAVGHNGRYHAIVSSTKRVREASDGDLDKALAAALDLIELAEEGKW